MQKYHREDVRCLPTTCIHQKQNIWWRELMNWLHEIHIIPWTESQDNNSVFLTSTVTMLKKQDMRTSVRAFPDHKALNISTASYVDVSKNCHQCYHKQAELDQAKIWRFMYSRNWEQDTWYRTRVCCLRVENNFRNSKPCSNVTIEQHTFKHAMGNWFIISDFNSSGGRITRSSSLQYKHIKPV